MKKWNKIFSVFFVLICLFNIETYGKNLKGVWKLCTTEAFSAVVNYKVFTADGCYYNLRGKVEKPAQYADNKLKVIFKKKEKLFSTFKITRSGTYKTLTSGLYVEQLDNYFDRAVNPVQKILISYQFEDKKMIIKFQLGEDVYKEVYEKVSKVEI